MPVEDLGHNLVVSTLAGATVTTGVCVRGLTIVMHQQVLPTDFVAILMREFSAIFGMDWIMRYRVLIDCQKMKVQFHLSRKD